jgi:hypothetical protein
MMKKIVLPFFVFFILIIFSCKKEEATQTHFGTALALKAKEAQKAKEEEKIAKVVHLDGKYPVMTFKTKEHDFGTIVQGEKVETVFNFKNTGESNLVISKAVGSCGCTVPEYPKEPIAPGKSAKIVVSFNSAGKNGKQMKTVSLTTNTLEGNEILTIKSLIQSKPGK